MSVPMDIRMFPYSIDSTFRASSIFIQGYVTASLFFNLSPVQKGFRAIAY